MEYYEQTIFSEACPRHCTCSCYYECDCKVMESYEIINQDAFEIMLEKCMFHKLQLNMFVSYPLEHQFHRTYFLFSDVELVFDLSITNLEQLYAWHIMVLGKHSFFTKAKIFCLGSIGLLFSANYSTSLSLHVQTISNFYTIITLFLKSQSWSCVFSCHLASLLTQSQTGPCKNCH